MVLLPGLIALAASLCLAGESPLSPPDEAVQRSFEQFVKGWMSKLERISAENSRNVHIQSCEGGYQGHFMCYGPECEYWIKPTGRRDTPYIGYLIYQEKEFLKRGCSPDEAKKDPGTVVSEMKVTEIFRYTKGKWVY